LNGIAFGSRAYCFSRFSTAATRAEATEIAVHPATVSVSELSETGVRVHCKKYPYIHGCLRRFLDILIIFIHQMHGKKQIKNNSEIQSGEKEINIGIMIK